MIEEKDTIDYKVTIKTGVKCHCSEIDPFGLCYVSQCMSCGNASVKIVRIEDGEVMRDDANGSIYQEKFDIIEYYTRNPIGFINNYIMPEGKTLSKWQEKYLQRMLNKK